jgi:hypothetical protein
MIISIMNASGSALPSGHFPQKTWPGPDFPLEMRPPREHFPEKACPAPHPGRTPVRLENAAK